MAMLNNQRVNIKSAVGYLSTTDQNTCPTCPSLQGYLGRTKHPSGPEPPGTSDLGIAGVGGNVLS